MTYKDPFSNRSPVSLLRFLRDDAPSALGGDGNAWLRLVDVAVAGMKRAGSPEYRNTYATIAIEAVEYMQLHVDMNPVNLAAIAIKVRVSCLLQSERDEQWKCNEALSIYRILEGQIDAIAEQNSSMSLQLKGMARWIARISNYLPSGERDIVRRWVNAETIT